MRKLCVLLFFGVIATAGAAWGASVHVTMTQVDSVGVGNIIGMIVFQDSLKGLKIMPVDFLGVPSKTFPFLG